MKKINIELSEHEYYLLDLLVEHSEGTREDIIKDLFLDMIRGFHPYFGKSIETGEKIIINELGNIQFVKGKDEQ